VDYLVMVGGLKEETLRGIEDRSSMYGSISAASGLFNHGAGQNWHIKGQLPRETSYKQRCESVSNPRHSGLQASTLITALSWRPVGGGGETHKQACRLQYRCLNSLDDTVLNKATHIQFNRWLRPALCTRMFINTYK